MRRTLPAFARIAPLAAGIVAAGLAGAYLAQSSGVVRLVQAATGRATAAAPSASEAADAGQPADGGHTPDAGQPADGGPAASRAGEVLLQSAILALERRQAVSARLRHQVRLFGKQIAGSGLYLQGPWQNRWLRCELKQQVAGRLVTQLQVCDGTYLWTYNSLPQEAELTRVDLARAARDLQGAAGPPLLDATGLGGLPQLLRSLDHSFQFGEIQEARLDDVHVLVVRGEWKPPVLAGLLGLASADQLPRSTGLPPQLPHQVQICFGRDDMFPYRIEYWQEQPPAAGSLPPARSYPVVRLEFFEVQLDGPLDPAQFAYNPGTLLVRDVTGKYVKNVRENR